MKISIKHLESLNQQTILLSENKINNLEELKSYRYNLEEKVRILKGKRENLWRKEVTMQKNTVFMRILTRLLRLSTRHISPSKNKVLGSENSYSLIPPPNIQVFDSFFYIAMIINFFPILIIISF